VSLIAEAGLVMPVPGATVTLVIGMILPGVNPVSPDGTVILISSTVPGAPTSSNPMSWVTNWPHTYIHALNPKLLVRNASTPGSTPATTVLLIVLGLGYVPVLDIAGIE
jgi:hypothetical protein